ncbi:helix-turn-helix transcriptional regulator [Streptomyces jietaisiensis]|uniref:Helix-turn-helix transcriptional regulator n=1 Tax=Streptomyces griseoaurantiacus TaxID=68213 RepID=A0ABZ1UWT7_9ACTN|nr:helix-turn-helix transcriptional regulator [Streptomyces jietaisiensis]
MYAERPSRMRGAVVWTREFEAPRPAGRAGPARQTGAEWPVLPDGCMDLLWTEGRLLVAGPDTRPYVPGGAPARWAGVRLPPGTAPALLGVPAHELRDRRVDLADLWPAARVRRLTARIDTAADPAGALETLAVERAAETQPPDPLLTEVAAALEAGRTVSATADSLGIGARTLHRRSRAAFGYGPKTLARILRLQRALRAGARGASPAEIASRTGYADQAHLTRELRALTGMTPGRLFRHREPLPSRAA